MIMNSIEKHVQQEYDDIFGSVPNTSFIVAIDDSDYTDETNMNIRVHSKEKMQSVITKPSMDAITICIFRQASELNKNDGVMHIKSVNLIPEERNNNQSGGVYSVYCHIEQQ